MCISVPVHEVNEHLWILLMLFHLNSVSKNHVKVEHQILDLQFHKGITGHSEAWFVHSSSSTWGLVQILLHTCSGKGVSRSSRSSSAYVRMVLSEWRRCSSLKFWDVPTSDDRDMVTCIFTRAKFCCKGKIRAHCDSWIYSSNVLYVSTGSILPHVITSTSKHKWPTMQRHLDLRFQSQSSASWAGKERRRRDFWQSQHYCCSDARDVGTSLHKALCPLQTASLGTTRTNILSLSLNTAYANIKCDLLFVSLKFKFLAQL